MASVKTGGTYKSKVAGSTIIESLVALVIITVIFGISSGIFMKVISSRSSMTRFTADQVLKNYAQKIRNGEIKAESVEFESGNMMVSVAIEKYGNSAFLKQMKISAKDKKGNSTAEWKELFIVKNTPNAP